MRRAEEGVRTLIIYFNVTRPVNNKFYHSNGHFDIEEYKRKMKFLSNWREFSSEGKKKLAQAYDLVTMNYNYTQGIPDELLKKVCGKYTNDEGQRVRISTIEVLESLAKSGFIRPLDKQPKRGCKFDKLEDGTYKKKCWWYNKYLLANEKQQYAMMMDKRYWSVENFPVDKDDATKYKGYLNAKNAIFKWIGKNKLANDVKQQESKSTPEPKAEEPKKKYTQEEAQALMQWGKELLQNTLDGIYDLPTAQRMIIDKGLSQAFADKFASIYNRKTSAANQDDPLSETHAKYYN